MMYILKLIGKIVMLPVVVVVTLVQWFMAPLVGFSSAVFYLIAGLFLLVAVLSYLMGLSAGSDALRMTLAGFVIFMIPVAGEAVVTAVAALNAGMREPIRS